MRARRNYLATTFEENLKGFLNSGKCFQKKEQSIEIAHGLDDQSMNDADEIVEPVDHRIESIEQDTANNSGYIQKSGGAEALTLVVYKRQNDTGRILREFNILKEVDLLEQNLNLNLYAEDGNARIHPKVAITKKEYAEGFIELCEQTNTTVKSKNLMVNFIHNTVGSIVDLPFTGKRKAAELGDEDDWESVCSDESDSRDLLKDSAIDNTFRYTTKQSKFFAFDQCPNDCTVFLGENKKLLHCPACSLPRFRDCSKVKCKTKGGNSCTHLLIDGLPLKQLYYRPIIVMIKDLLSLPKFEYYLNYERRHNRRHNSQHLSDFMDGEIARAHLNEMKIYGREWIAKDPDNRGDSILINLLLSEFYDSGQLFKSYVFDFWPLCIGILNMPPSLRGKIGLSYFLAALYTGKHTEAERIMFNDLVCEELRCLYEGIEYDVNGKKYFIQARLVMHILDTKAAEPVMGYQSNANSNFGCSNCGGVTGIHIGNKCVYLGNRNYLPQLHVTRFFGQTGYCCPAGFYDHENKGQWQVEEHFHHLDVQKYETFFADRWEIVPHVINKSKKATKSITSTEQRRDTVNSILSEPNTQYVLDDKFSACDRNEKTKTSILNFLFHEDGQYQWFHTGEFGFEEIFKLFAEFLYYRHQDYRTQKPYRRVTYDQYQIYAAEAELLNSRSRAKAKKSVNGIQGLWYWIRLQYGDLETQFTWPLVHAIAGVVVKILRLIVNDHYQKGKVFYKIKNLRAPKEKKRQRVRGVAKVITKVKGCDEGENEEGNSDVEGGEKVVDEESDNEDEEDGVSIDKKKRFRPQYSKRKAPYQVFSKTNTDKVQAWLDCILLPPGLSDDWNVSLTSPSSMKISQKLKMLLCYWDFVMESLHIHKAYKTFFRMLAHDMTRLLSYSIEKSEVENLLYSVIETNAVWEGMMPIESNSFQVHELVDLPLSFKYYGPPSAVSELPGERMMKKMKDWKLKTNLGGNQSFLKVIMRKQIHFESWKMKRQYSHWPAKNDPHFCRRPSTTQLIYNEIPFGIHSPERHVQLPTLNEFEVEHLCFTLYAEVTRNFGGKHDECEKSAIYRIFNNKAVPSLSWVDKLKYFVDETNSSKLNAVDIVVAGNLLNFQPQFHKNALVYGTKFHSRGSQCRETKLSSNYVRAFGRDTYSPSNKKIWRWFEKAHYRSWCKFQCPGRSARYGLLNAFFSVSSIGDEVLKDLLLASTTSFYFERTQTCKVETVKREESFDRNKLFIALQDIYPTQIGTIPFTTEGLAITSSNTKVDTAMGKYVVSRFDNSLIQPNQYVMILLHPDRLSLQPSVNERKFSKFMF